MNKERMNEEWMKNEWLNEWLNERRMNEEWMKNEIMNVTHTETQGRYKNILVLSFILEELEQISIFCFCYLFSKLQILNLIF